MRGALALVLMVWLAAVGARGEMLVFETIGGIREAVFAKDGAKAAVLVFIDVECPIANAFQPELRRLEEKFGGRGVRFVLIHADPETGVEQAKAHAEEYGITAPVCIDEGQRWVKRTGATVTPEAVVLDAAGKTIYKGRIDDRYAAIGKKRPEAKVRDLEVALAAVVAGEPVKVAETEAVGCLIFVEE
jgi:phage terminase large subunit-like protein